MRNSLRVILVALSLVTLGLVSSPVADTDLAPYGVSIELEHHALQGHFSDVAITLSRADTSAGYGLGGFDLLVAYGNHALNFQSAREGGRYDACGWEYFTYHLGSRYEERQYGNIYFCAGRKRSCVVY